jgi:hypothetical protein
MAKSWDLGLGLDMFFGEREDGSFLFRFNHDISGSLLSYQSECGQE